MAHGLGDKLRPERGTADADEQKLLEGLTIGSFHLARMHLRGEGLEIRERTSDRLFQLRRRREIRIAQPVVADHPAFVGIGDRTGFQRRDVGKSLVDFRSHAAVKLRPDVHQREIERKAELRVAEERLIVGLPGHRGRS